MENYYKILEINPDASNKEVKQQYYLLVHAWHPDKFPESLRNVVHERIIKINEAYAVLGNPSKRIVYDKQRLSNPSTNDAPYYSNNFEKERRAKQEESQKQYDATKRQHQIERIEHRILNLALEANQLSSEAPKKLTAILLFLIFTVNGLAGVITAIGMEIKWINIFIGIVFICLGITSLYRYIFQKKKYAINVQPKITGKIQEIKRLAQERDLLLTSQKQPG